MIASDKCYQLAQSLYSMSTRIPYEDVQTAATQLISMYFKCFNCKIIIIMKDLYNI